MEQRKFQRFKIHQMVETSLDGERFIPVDGLDISEGGLRCCSSEPVDPLARIELLVSLPGENEEHLIKAEATVVRVEKIGDDYHLGVQFDALLSEDLEALRAYLEILKDSPEDSPA